MQKPPEPRAFNVPRAVLALAGAFVAVHVVRALLPAQAAITFLLTFAFIPARYAAESAIAAVLPGGSAAAVWGFVTYMFLHGDAFHLLVNCVWMLAFGSVLARRLGASRFLAFSVTCAVAGAALHLFSRWGDPVPVVGASAAISGQMAGAVRFVFLPAGQPGQFGLPRRNMRTMTPASLRQVLSNPGALLFLGVWAGINLIAGVAGMVPGGERAEIAWEAHFGGFIAGLLLFGLFDGAARKRRGSP